MPLLHIQDQDELEKVLKQSGRKLVVVCFSSDHCGPCKTTTPRIELMSQQMPDVVFVFVNVNKADEFVERYEIVGVPTFCFFRNMCQLYRFQGGNADFLCSKVEELRFQI
ncbi:thioredoxin-like [Bufo gargarizans]|uniref:thioredoxin-like n=1 Tax=Bufo gargarizans TaxID=30331 RepID=UPI001CF46994|nr:thioredoxin-like [Bufo gargarizans]